ncbi:MFS transporter [Terriglobus albidus]|uniref:MFS transporter n=1 Tax=Terriglobus albidus TaxID=1592106 RepID=UPI0021DF4766|nr:MFS transporter [Terriglobus albidus]
MNLSLAALGTSDPALNRATSRTVKRLVPFLMLMYVVSFLDRSNVGFVKQVLETSEGISESIYALGAGLFFVGYSLCGFPSNLILHKVGAKKWLAILMVGWGAVSMATMLVRGPASFYFLRLLLGVLEAGFFPGAILYLTYWFPNGIRGRILGLFYLGVPLALIFGGPLSGLLLEMPPFFGLQSWQWMFLVEGFMAVVLGLFAFWYLDDRPSKASWLPAEEKQALANTLMREDEERRSAGPTKLLPMFRDLRVMHFLLIYALIQTSTYGAVFYLPAEISALMHRPVGIEVGVVSAIPWICTLAAVYFLPHVADRFHKHRQLATLALMISGCASFAFPSCGAGMGLVMLSLAVAGFIAVQPLFWTFPTGYLADRAAAGGIAVIGMGNLGGFLAPNLKVWADTYFGSQHAGLYLLAALTVLNAGLIALVKSRPAQSTT